MVTLTREALTDDASPPISATGRSSRQEAPRRSSLRSSRPTSLTQTPGRPPAKHVSFVSDDDASSISPRSSISITPQPLRAVHVPRREPSIASSHSSSSSSSSSLRVDPVPTYASPPAPAPAARTHPAPVAVHMQALSLTAEPNLHVMASRRAAEPPPPVDPSLRGARPATPKPRTRPSPPSDVSASQEEHPPPRVHSRASTRPSQLRSTPSRRFLTAEPLVTMVVAKPPSSETPTSAPPRVSVDDAMATHMSEHQQQQGYVPTDHAESRSLEAVGRILLKAPGTMNKLALRAAAATMLRKAPASHAWPARPSSSSDAGWGAAPPSPPHAVPTTTWTRRVSSSSDLHVLATGRRPSSPPKTEAQQPLRPIVLPAIVATKFLALAEAHTRADIETIGILLGRGEGTLHVTHLLLPPQHGTSVSCVAHGEETILAYQLDNDLMTLGWIHTHPTQTCFLSSLDLHTHASFQALLPEAIAVVCAPSKQPSLGVFRLTNPPGLQFVLHCNDPAPFHPHVVPGDPQHTLPLYTDVAASHVQWSEEAPLRILDWRHKAA
ncbi:metal-dependent deubiquitinase [Malassezia pachydermatis]